MCRNQILHVMSVCVCFGELMGPRGRAGEGGGGGGHRSFGRHIGIHHLTDNFQRPSWLTADTYCGSGTHSVCPEHRNVAQLTNTVTVTRQRPIAKRFFQAGRGCKLFTKYIRILMRFWNPFIRGLYVTNIQSRKQWSYGFRSNKSFIGKLLFYGQMALDVSVADEYNR